MVWGVELCGAFAHHHDHLRQQWSGGWNSVESLLINCLDIIITIITIIVMTIFTSALQWSGGGALWRLDSLLITCFATKRLFLVLKRTKIDLVKLCFKISKK